MAMPQGNVIDLRKNMKKPVRQKAPLAAKQTKSVRPTVELNEEGILLEFRTLEPVHQPNLVILGVLGAIDIGLIAFFALSYNYLASLIFLLAGMSVLLMAFGKDKKPKETECRIKGDGVQRNNTTYSYEDIKSFWIFYDPPYHQELRLEFPKGMAQHVKIPLGQEDPVRIRELLIRFIPEKKQEETLTEILERVIGI